MQAQSQLSNPPFRCHGTSGYFVRYPQIRTAQAVEVVLGWCDDWALGVGGDRRRRCAVQGGMRDEGCPLSNPTPSQSSRQTLATRLGLGVWRQCGTVVGSEQGPSQGPFARDG